MPPYKTFVTPAQAGVQGKDVMAGFVGAVSARDGAYAGMAGAHAGLPAAIFKNWIPAFAGMTKKNF